MRDLLRDDTGQDVVEYALLGAFVGVVGILVWQGIVDLIGERYSEYNSNLPYHWETPTPWYLGS
jgi:Flp pilus assembly pilin Flp